MLTTGELAERLSKVLGRHVPVGRVQYVIRSKGLKAAVSAGRRIRLYGPEVIDLLATLV